MKSAFVYEYDFGDSWDHRITVEKILDPDPAAARSRGAWTAHALARRTTAVASVDTPICLKSSWIPNTRSTSP